MTTAAFFDIGDVAPGRSFEAARASRRPPRWSGGRSSWPVAGSYVRDICRAVTVAAWLSATR
jgi:hypothetical protein